jgi:hypothetical protein
MSKIASEMMDREFFYASQADSILGLLHEMERRGLGTVPVLDPAGRPVAMASAREVEGCHNVEELLGRVCQSVVSIGQQATLEEAAWALAERNADTLLLVDERGVAVGALRALDLLRATLGCDRVLENPATQGKPHWVRAKAAHLDLDALRHTAATPGVLMLYGTNDPACCRPLWVEATENLRERLDEMLRLPQHDSKLESLLAVYPRTLRFRALVVRDPERRERFARSVSRVLRRTQPPPLAS